MSEGRQGTLDIWDALSKVYNMDNVPDEAKSIIGDVMLELPSAQPEIIRCKDCKYCEHWYADKGRCFLWHEDGIDVFEEGFCNYAERRTDG